MLVASLGEVIAEVSLVEQIQNGLIAHYSFDQDWTDSSGNQRDLSVYSSSI